MIDGIPVTAESLRAVGEEADTTHNRAVGRYLQVVLFGLLGVLALVKFPGIAVAFFVLAIVFAFFGAKHSARERDLRLRLRLMMDEAGHQDD